MRILLVNSEHPPVGGGAGNASAHIARELVRMGEDVAILTGRYRDFPVDEVEEGVRIYRCLSFRRAEDRSTPWEQLSFLLGGLTDGLNFARKWQPEVVITFFGIPSGPVGWAARHLWGVPYIVSLRGGDVPGFRPYDFRWVHRMTAPVVRAVWRRAGAVVANSQGLRDLALDFHPRADIGVIPNGVDLEAYRPKEEYAGPPALLFVGRVVYQKGLDMLLEALKDAGDGNWDLAIAGDGPEVEPLKRMSAAYGIGDRIHFLGWVGREELRDIYRRANIFVFPSRHEGMPNALLEAMASGLPAVASHIAGNEELVVHGETGYLFSLEERAGLRHHLQKLMVDAGLRRQLGEAARARVEKKYSWRRTAEGYLELARQLVR